jgi:hypothetical protein
MILKGDLMKKILKIFEDFEKLNLFKITNISKLKEYIYFCTNNNVEGVEETDNLTTNIHHIIPTCLINDYKDLKVHNFNKSVLSIRNHIKAHIMLCEAIDHHLLKYTVRMMTQVNKYEGITEEEIALIAKIKEQANLKFSENSMGKKTYTDGKKTYTLDINSTKSRDFIRKNRLYATNSLEYIILDNFGNEVYKGKYNMEELCKEKNLPFNELRISKLRGGEKIDKYKGSKTPILLHWRCYVIGRYDETLHRTPLQEIIKYHILDNNGEVVYKIPSNENFTDFCRRHKLPTTALKNTLSNGCIYLNEEIHNSRKIKNLSPFKGWRLIDITNKSSNFRCKKIHKPIFKIYVNSILTDSYEGLFINNYMKNNYDIDHKKTKKGLEGNIIMKKGDEIIIIGENSPNIGDYKKPQKKERKKDIKRTVMCKLYKIEDGRLIDTTTFSSVRDRNCYKKNNNIPINRGVYNKGKYIIYTYDMEKVKEYTKAKYVLCKDGKIIKHIYSGAISFCTNNKYSLALAKQNLNKVIQKGKFKGYSIKEVDFE